MSGSPIFEVLLKDDDVAIEAYDHDVMYNIAGNGTESSSHWIGVTRPWRAFPLIHAVYRRAIKCVKKILRTDYPNKIEIHGNCVVLGPLHQRT